MILLVTGGRNFVDFESFASAMRGLPSPVDLIIQGGARGADALAKRYAKQQGIHCAEVLAMWDFSGKAAGGIRNSAMLLLKPDYCLAMPGGTGTADMVKKCEVAGVPVWKPFG